MHVCQAVGCDAGTQIAVVIAGFVAVEAGTAKVGQMWKETVAVAAAISVSTVGAVVAPRCFAETSKLPVDVVALSGEGFVAILGGEIVVIVFVVAAYVIDQLAGLSVGEIVSLVVVVSMGMYFYWLTGYFVVLEHLLRLTAVAEAEHKIQVAVQIDL